MPPPFKTISSNAYLTGVINPEIEIESEMSSHIDNAETPLSEQYEMFTTANASVAQNRAIHGNSSTTCANMLTWEKSLARAIEC